MTGRKPRPKEPKKKATKSRAEYPSTNVSSPVRGPTKRDLGRFAFEQHDEDDDDGTFEPAARPSRAKKPGGYKADGLTVPDEEGSDEDFALSRVAKPRRQTKLQKTLGAPIVVDQRLADLTNFQKDVLRDFMEGAKSMVRDIKFKRGYRYAPFSDTILREMCLRLPRDKDEMLRIPNIRAEMVNLHGTAFLRLINNTRKAFGNEAPSSENQPSRRPSIIEVPDDDDDDDDEMPMDPNHVNVIDLCQETDDEAPAETESNYSMPGGAEDVEEDAEVHVSHYFNQAVDPMVEQFNNRFSQIEAERPNPRPKAPAASRSSASRIGGKAGYFKKRGGFGKRRSSGSGSRQSYGGVSKRGGSKAPASRRSGGTGGSRSAPSGGSRRPGGGAGGNLAGYGSIAAMPT